MPRTAVWQPSGRFSPRSGQLEAAQLGAAAMQRNPQWERNAGVALDLADQDRGAGAQFPTGQAAAQVVLVEGGCAGHLREPTHQQQCPRGGHSGDAGGEAVTLVGAQAVIAAAVDDQAVVVTDVEVTEPGNVAQQEVWQRGGADCPGAGPVERGPDELEPDHLP